MNLTTVNHNRPNTVQRHRNTYDTAENMPVCMANNFDQSLMSTNFISASLASLAGLVLSFIACFFLFYLWSLLYCCFVIKLDQTTVNTQRGQCLRTPTSTKRPMTAIFWNSLASCRLQSLHTKRSVTHCVNLQLVLHLFLSMLRQANCFLTCCWHN